MPLQAMFQRIGLRHSFSPMASTASVLITGASKGIGMATALELAREGYTVYATMRDPKGSPDLAIAAEREGLPIKVFTMGHSGRHAANARRRSGCIINISSVAGKLSSPPMTAYSASKWALEALSEGLAAEAKLFGIRVYIVESGIIDTAMAHRVTKPPQSIYPHGQQMAALFASALQHPPKPDVVAQKILNLIESGTPKLRHPAGPDAEGYIQMRAATSDEEWISRGADGTILLDID
jgi:NAD(P)-dependent dehydrogenase (short-subunit alcohol dehydrogenase family)